jgi:hypothetical protein
MDGLARLLQQGGGGMGGMGGPPAETTVSDT